ncbi:MAG: hypothetical protein LUG60_01240 [Erysipelotrichaceae bacterium]|nr:hypothetical protein [Erysipelotrichaceae bacterium]
MKKLLKMFLASLIAITLIACGSSSVDWWSATGIGAILPIPTKGNGEVYSDTADYFNAYVEDVGEGDFSDYVDACIGVGFDVDSDASTDDYFAYNEDGLELTLYYYDGEYSISLESSKVDSTYTWPTSGLGTLLPEPKSNVGTITTDSSNSFTVYVGESTEEDISNYINECIKAGFDVDYSKDSTSLYAYNEAGISITINDRGFNIMYVSLYGDDDEVAEALGKSTGTSSESSESSDSSISSSSSSSGIRDEFKEAMDSYEDFFDEYIAFMEKYASADSGDALSMLSDYSSYLTKYSETMEKMDAWEDDDLTDEELAYYVEVTARITKKLSEANI